MRLSSGSAQVEAALRLAEACDSAGDPMAARPALEQVHLAAPEQEAHPASSAANANESTRAYHDWARMVLAEADAASRGAL